MNILLVTALLSLSVLFGAEISDPMFVDHIHGDFGFKPGSPALALDIKPLPLETVRQMGTSRDPFLKRFPEGVPMGFKQTVKENGSDKKNKELNL